MRRRSRRLKNLPKTLDELRRRYPHKQVELWFQDESRIGQKGSRTRSWALKGTRPSAPVDTRYRNCYLFGAFCPARDTGVALVLPLVNTEMMQKHLDEIACRLPQKTHAAMVMDRAGWHTTDKLRVPDNITLILLPPAAPECNPAEKPWQYLKDNYLSHRIFETNTEIIDAACEAWNALINEKGRIATLTQYNSIYQITS